MQETAVTMDPPRTFRRVPLLPHQMTSKLTAQRDLFVLAHVGIPRVDASAWTLRISGLVRNPASFTFDEIRQMPKIEVESFHQCAGYPSNPTIATRRVGNVVWGGVDLKTLLDSLGILPEARFLWSYGLDRGEYDGLRSGPYLKDCPLDRLQGGGILLAYEINGEPLDAEHGFPLRLLIPGFYGTNCVKWLSRLHLADARADGPFTTLLYNDPDGAGTRPVWQVAPESVIVSPAPESHVGPRDVEIWGWAWADSGVSTVEISVDGGQSWRVAELEPRSGWRWQKFRTIWDAGGEGEAVLMSRATDRQGKMQPASDWRNCVYGVKVSRRSHA
ncbi:MAG: molybdopterin-dependent oxidoreductase [Pseudolabrys sp.]|jgi:sulfane dehydrogenase subunit SoxC